MVGNYLNCWVRKKSDDEQILCVRLMNSKGFDRCAFFSSKKHNFDDIYKVLDNLTVGQKIAIDVNLWHGTDGRLLYSYEGVYALE